MTTKNLTFEKSNTKTTTNSLAGKLIEVMRECGYVRKDAKNSFHKYSYASAAAILEKVNEALCKNGLATLMKSEILSHTIEGKEKFVTVKVTISLVDADTGERMEISGIGSGQDSGDKAIAKAQTMALKYAWMMSLNISTGDDPEADESTDHRNHHKYVSASFVNFNNGQQSVTRGAEHWVKQFEKVKNEEEFKALKKEMGVDTYNKFSEEDKSIVQEAANKAKERFENGQ